ncbi:Diacetyl reductase [(S)-acetoin forming] [Grifola frondosa]|uniref:Diacetyl reductase [(S)-acetoin forming] n=1 Tax=Grifola frondosa TaxID=5627 RepID=A0A1C7ML08_GRIFR|nr:Diacetyl reductase [(S)-acetoin forming] [Grifola frondosa]
MSAPRVALVTGADIAVNDIPSKGDQIASVVKAIEAKGRRAIAVPGDISSEADVIAVIEKVVDDLGGLDVMVANAGILAVRPLVDMSVDEWDRVMAINARGVMLSYKHAARQMIKQGRGGRIIGACSAAGKKGLGNGSAYSASKFAVRGLTQSAAQELAKYKITVNCYAPGGIMTSIGLLPDDEKNGGPGSTAKQLFGLPADMDVAEPAVIASIVSYLVKPEAYFISGQSINVNGGVLFD